MSLEHIPRDTIIQTIKDGFIKDERVYALWLEGSDGTNTLDEYSDLDLVMDVEDGTEEGIFGRLEQMLGTLGELDLIVGPDRPGPKLMYKVYHLENTAPTLLLDVTIQSHSRQFAFDRKNEYEVPKVLFDKAGVIQYRDSEGMNAQTRRDKTYNRMKQLDGVFKQRIRAIKYVQRNHYLEAHAYYHKYVLNPLVELLRIRYTPLISDYYLVHISQHLPAEAVDQLEELYRNQSTSDISRNMERANAWFHTTYQELLLSLQ